MSEGTMRRGEGLHVHSARYEPLGQEFPVVSDSWALRCARSVLDGLIASEQRGGLRIVSFELRSDEDVLAVVLEHHRSGPVLRVGYRLVLSKLRDWAREDDPASAASLYLEDMAQPWTLPGSEPVDGIHWIIRPYP
jgi:hypothetical protein